MRHVVIMAGGAGTRLWPLSRQGTPKQMLKMIGGKSLLRIAFERALHLAEPENIWICTGAAYADLVAADLPELPAANILGEPVGRDSLNAVAWPAAVIARRDPQAVIAQLAADHIIEPVADFVATVDRAYAVAETDAHALVTLGVVPTSAHTGYGYLHRGAEVGHGAFAVAEFREKPDAATAQTYVDSGEYWWNSGMFVWQAQTLLDQLALLLPQTHASVLELAAHPERVGEIYPKLHKTSVDYGVMEPVSQGRGSAHVLAVPLEVSWQDVGGFVSLAAQFASDETGNATDGLTVTLDSANNVIISTQGLVALLGVRDMVVVRTSEISMMCPRSESERIRELVAKVSNTVGSQFA